MKAAAFVARSHALQRSSLFLRVDTHQIQSSHRIKSEISRATALCVSRYNHNSSRDSIWQKRNISSTQKAIDLNQKGVDEALADFDDNIVESQEKQNKAPWHREGVDRPPVDKQRSSSAMTMGVFSMISKLIPMTDKTQESY